MANIYTVAGRFWRENAGVIVHSVDVFVMRCGFVNILLVLSIVWTEEVGAEERVYVQGTLL